MFTFWFPTTQSPETDINFAIRPNKIIGSILFSVPVIHGKKWYVNCLRLFFPFAQWTQWNNYDTSDLNSQFYWLRTYRILDAIFEIRTIFLRFFLSRISYSNFWVDRSFQASAQTISNIRLRTISLKFPSSISLLLPNILVSLSLSLSLYIYIYMYIYIYIYIYIFLCSVKTLSR